MSKIPTTDELFNTYAQMCVFEEGPNEKLIDKADFKQCLLEFAKKHVQAALNAASEKASVTPIDHEEIAEGSFRPIWGVDDDSILTSYPLENIK